MHPGTIRHYVMVAETKNLKTLRFDHSRACCVRLLTLVRKMLSPIKLDHQACGVAYEVGNVGFDGNLASESSSFQSMITQL